MNFQHFDRVLSEISYDEIKVVGKDVEAEGHYAHIVGMTLKDRQALVYILEIIEHSEEEKETFQDSTDKTHREEMKGRCQDEIIHSFMAIRKFRSNGITYEVAGATSGVTGEYNLGKNMLFFLKMRENGWRIPESSFLYTIDWNCMTLSVIELRDELEELPDWGMDMEVIKDNQPKTETLEIPVTLSCGQEENIHFTLSDGTQAVCYINKVYLQDVWADNDRRFADVEYQKRMLEHMSMEEFEDMKKHYEEALLANCPKGRCYMVVEYECSEDVAINIYAKSYLDSKLQASSGSTSSIIMMLKPNEEVGKHGLKLRGCIIQIPIEPDATTLDTELFSYSKLIRQHVVKLY